MLGDKIAKMFYADIYIGTITSVDTDTSYQNLWRVNYEDGDFEDLDLPELIQGLDLYRTVPAPYRT